MSAAEADEFMVSEWNKVVRPCDKIYHLGDVAIQRSSLQVVSRLNGHKVLIRGNHDIFKLKDYIPYFDDIRGTHKLEKYILSHYPIDHGSIPRWCVANIHGHTHIRTVRKARLFGLLGNVSDPRYINICVEHTGYAPVPFELIKSRQTK